MDRLVYINVRIFFEAMESMYEVYTQLFYSFSGTLEEVYFSSQCSYHRSLIYILALVAQSSMSKVLHIATEKKQAVIARVLWNISHYSGFRHLWKFLRLQ